MPCMAVKMTGPPRRPSFMRPWPPSVAWKRRILTLHGSQHLWPAFRRRGNGTNASKVEKAEMAEVVKCKDGFHNICQCVIETLDSCRILQVLMDRNKPLRHQEYRRFDIFAISPGHNLQHTPSSLRLVDCVFIIFPSNSST